MKEAGFTPTRDTNIIVLRVHAKHGDVAAILSEIERLNAEKIAVGDKDILDVVYGLAVNGHGANCVQLFDLLTKGNNYVRFAANTIIRLAQKGHDDVALKLLKTLPPKKSASGENYNSGAFFLQQLVKADRPLDDILAICKELEAEGIHSSPLQVVLPKLCDSGPSDLVLTLFRDRKARGESLREDNFRPLFNSTNEADVRESLRSMIQEFDIKPSPHFIKSTVLPKLNVHTPEAALNSLIAANVPTVPSALALTAHCLEHKQLKNAADIIRHFRMRVNLKFYQPLLISALKETNDARSFVLFLRVHFENSQRLHEGSTSAETLNEGADEAIEQLSDPKTSDDWATLIVETFAALPEKQRFRAIAAVLKELVEQGVTITPQQAEIIRNKVQPTAEGSIRKHLDQLASGSLELKPIEKSNWKIKSPSSRLEQILAEGRAQDVGSLQNELLRAYYREGQTKKFEDFIQKLESNNEKVAGSMHALLIQLKVQEKDLTSAVEWFTKIKAQNNEFFLFTDTAIDIVSWYIENGQMDEALKFATETRRATAAEEGYFSAANLRCRELLNRLADEGKATELNQIFESLVENGHAKVSNKLLGPLVRVHLVNNDLNKAVETFEKLANQYKETPIKGMLVAHIIRNGEMEILQKVVDISATVHGEHNVLTDLAFSFIECGETEQAQRVFEMPNLYPNQRSVQAKSEKFNKDGSIEMLENLAEATRGAKSLRREPIYLNLLDLYINEDNSEKAFQLWVTIQEENEVATDEFLKKLGLYLKSRKIDVPFEIPEEKKEKKTKIDVKSVQQAKQAAPKPLNNATSKGSKGKTNPVNKTVGKVYDFVGVLDTATSPEVIKQYQQLSDSDLAGIIENISGTKRLSKLFNILAEAGNVKEIEKVNSLLPETDQDRLWFNNSRAKAYVVSGQGSEWLDEWNKKLDSVATAEELRDFPCSGFFYLIEHDAQLFAKCKNFHSLIFFDKF